jgi:restriction system protein
LIARLLQEKGFQTTVTPATHDGGKDIIATKDAEGQQYVLLVECKKWVEGKVGIDIIQRAFGVKYINSADECMVCNDCKIF